MSEFADVVRLRRMTRSFSGRALPDGLLADLVDLASRSPSAGKAQGWHLVVLEGSDTTRFWDVTLAPDRRAGFRWQGLLDAPIIALPLADPLAYVGRYAEADKASTGLGDGVEAWPVPYWTVDAGMAVMTFLHAAQDAGLGALFFGVFRGEAELRRELAIPDHLDLLGAIALGYPSDDFGDDAGQSAGRERRSPADIIHRGGFRAT